MAVPVGLVGAGRRATEVHAPALASSPDLEFVGVWTRRKEAAAELADRYGVRVFPQFRDLLAACEAVSFAVPPAVQSDLGSTAASLGRSVLLEVPIAWDLAGAEDLAEAVVASGAVSQVAFTWRYTHAVRQLLLARAEAIRPRHCSGRIIRAERDTVSRANRWRRERGLLLDVGPHVADFLDAALGEIVDVDATDDENGSISLTMEHRVGGSSQVVLGSSTTIDHDHAVFEFVGPRGSTFVDCSSAETTADYATMFAEFADAVRAGEPHELDVRRGLRIQRVVEAADTRLLLGR